MTIETWLKAAITKLESASVPTAKLDAEVLLADILDKDRTWIHAHSEFILPEEDLCKLDGQIERRMTHEPLAYIRGKQEFYGHDFEVSPDTLTPRPETETMIDLAINQIEDWRLKTGDISKTNPQSPIPNLSVVDVGTGSGCIIITMALELSKVKGLKSKVSYTGLDISEPALKVARKNAKNLKANVDFNKFDLLSNAFDVGHSTFDIILANLPYIPNDFHINLAATHEPDFAIYGGRDGLDYYRALFTQLSTFDFRHSTVLTESLPPQHLELAKIANNAGFELVKAQDFIQLFERLEIRD